MRVSVRYSELVRRKRQGEVTILKISARNVLSGKIARITKGAVNAEIVLSLRGGETVIAIIYQPER
jgi:ABC-type molybdate transport system ATPase subunit